MTDEVPSHGVDPIEPVVASPRPLRKKEIYALMKLAMDKDAVPLLVEPRDKGFVLRYAFNGEETSFELEAEDWEIWHIIVFDHFADLLQ